jgi:tetratricopeptide (TPR) repeat protein
MPDATNGRLFDQALADWRAALERVSREADGAGALLEERLEGADSEGEFEAVRARVSELRKTGARTVHALESMLRRHAELYMEWRAERRYEPEVLDRRVEELAVLVADRPEQAGQQWLAEVFDALDALEGSAVDRFASADVPWPPALRPGARRIGDALRQWKSGDHETGRELLEALAEQGLEGWERVLGPRLRSRAHRLAAWVALRRLRRPDEAGRHLSQAIELFPYEGRMHAERAAYYLSIGQLDLAATDAQHAVELATDDAAGYVELGIWAELRADFDDADELYRKALRLLPTLDVARLHTRAALLDPPGRLLIAAAERLLEARRPADALELAERALTADLRGSELHPQAAAHRLRSVALERIAGGGTPEAAAAAAEAGKLYVWNGDMGTAIEQFERALALDGESEEVGWLLADARLSTSLPLGSSMPDAALVAQAREHWVQWAAKVGLPKGDTSWAYLTRAIIADLATQQTGADRLSGVWEALMYVEKAIVHDDVDAQRWGYAAQYLRYAGLRALAFEAAERGYRLSAGDRQVLVERLPLLADRGKLEEAEEVAQMLVTMFGNDPWVSAARAWLALRTKRETRYREALELLDLPLAAGNDPGWYYELRALCLTALGDAERAREDMRRLLASAPAIDGTTKCRLAAAAVAVGDMDDAGRWLDEAKADPTSRPVVCASVAGFVQLAEDELDAAAELLGNAAQHAESAVELEDMLELTRARLAMLPAGADQAAARARVVDALERGTVAQRIQWLHEHSPDADAELAERSRRVPDVELIRTTLGAIRGRRMLQAGLPEDAELAYRKLIGSPFEPEATLGLTKAIWALASERSAAGDSDAVRRLFDQLNALRGVSVAETAIAVASALERQGAYADARTELVRAIEAARDPSELQELHQRAGGMALADDDVEAAARHFTTALESARACGDPVRIGQSEVRLALVAVHQRDHTAAATHLVAATRAWREAGAFDPRVALVGELRGLAERGRGGSWAGPASEALRLVEDVVKPYDGGATSTPALEALWRELTANR